MAQMGIGAMLYALSGGSKKDPKDYYGKTIISAEIKDEQLRLRFSDGTGLRLWDDGQSCCEHRYMSTDDDVQTLVGGVLARIEAKAGPYQEDEYEVQEQIFVEVGTDKGFITLVNHNEHNGYYGGFGLSVDDLEVGQ